MTDLYARASRIFKTDGGAILWPYGLHDPDWRLKRRDPEVYERQVAEQPPKQQLIVEWAEQYGLRESRAGCCPRWLQRRVSRRCEFGACTHYGAGGADRSWLDHTVAWLKDRKPVAITSAPYSVGDPDDERIAWWLGYDSRLRSARGIGWYGHGTTQIVLWRSDLIPAIEPATPKNGATP